MDEAPAPETSRKRKKVVDKVKSQDTDDNLGDSSLLSTDSDYFFPLREFSLSWKRPSAATHPQNRRDSLFQSTSFSTPGLFNPDPMNYYANFLEPEAMKSLTNILEKSNQLSEKDQHIIINFLKGNRTKPQPDKGSTVTILLNSEVEMIIRVEHSSWKFFLR